MTNNEKQKKTTAAEVKKFLNKTGFILEMEVAEYLKTKGYKIDVNQYFLDHDSDKKREIDIVASKTINNIKLVMVIECKQKTSVDWIFVCSDKSPSRYYDYIKYFPRMPYTQPIDETKIFHGLRQLDHKIPLAQNSTIRRASGHRDDSKDIYECLKKLPKALLGIVEEKWFSQEDMTIITPVVVFNGQLFTAEYSEKLVTKEVKSVQHAVELDSEKYNYDYEIPTFRSLSVLSAGEYSKENSSIARLSHKLGSRYLIEFVTKNGLPSFLKDTEKRIEDIDTELWPSIKENEDNPSKE